MQVKKLPIVIFSAFVLFIVYGLTCLPAGRSFIVPVYGQTTNQQAIDDYFFQLQKYREFHDEYTLARDTYKKFGTLASKTEAFNKTKTHLTQTITLLAAHNNAVITILANNKGLTNEQRDKYIQSQKAYKTKFDNFQLRINQTKRLEDFNVLADEIEEEKTKFDENSKLSVALSKIGLIQNNVISLNQYIGLIDLKISAARRSGKNVSLFEIGPQEIRKRLTLVNSQTDLAYKKLESGDFSASGKTSQVEQILENSRKELLEATSFFKEIIRNLI